MSERIEFHGDLTRPEAVPGIGLSREAHSKEAKEKFALELEKRLSQEKDKTKSQDEEDKIVIHQDGDQKDDKAENENKNNSEDNSQDKFSNSDEFKVNKINLLA